MYSPARTNERTNCRRRRRRRRRRRGHNDSVIGHTDTLRLSLLLLSQLLLLLLLLLLPSFVVVDSQVKQMVNYSCALSHFTHSLTHSLTPPRRDEDHAKSEPLRSHRLLLSSLLLLLLLSLLLLLLLSLSSKLEYQSNENN